MRDQHLTAALGETMRCIRRTPAKVRRASRMGMASNADRKMMEMMEHGSPWSILGSPSPAKRHAVGFSDGLLELAVLRRLMRLLMLESPVALSLEGLRSTAIC